LERLFSTLQQHKAQGAGMGEPLWSIEGDPDAGRSFHRLELGYLVYVGRLGPEDSVVSPAGERYRVGEQDWLAQWLDRTSGQQERLLRGLLRCMPRPTVQPGQRPQQQPAQSDTTRAFSLLGVTATCDLVKAKARHRQLAMRHHPDRGGAVERMQELNWALGVVKQRLLSYSERP